MPTTVRSFVPHSIEDRSWWEQRLTHPATAEPAREVIRRAEEAPARPPTPLASDFLAARRFNDRARVDHHWGVHRPMLGDLVVRRCLLGIDPADPDDRLLDWIWANVTQPSWVVSAHLPGNDLPDPARPQLDLAACEMAAVLAEIREVLLPWINQHTQTLADTIVHEIDRRVLAPFAEGAADGWWGSLEPRADRNNWTGVCAGSILAACVSLERQGHPRPQAKQRAIRLLNIFLREGVTPGGECDEGVMYWLYGVGMACLGLQCLTADELRAQVDVERLRQVAGYPGRAHLYDDVFFAGNDSGMRARAAAYFIPWLAQVTGDAFLHRWSARFTSADGRSASTLLRVLEWLPDVPSAADLPEAPALRTQYLEDQQVAIVRRQSRGRRLLVALSGGTNAERHNHNDLGHFLVAVDEQVIVPDLGAPRYATDFFGPRRYTYLSASSRGHCCPLINGVEQRPGREAKGTVLQRELAGEKASFALDLTAAYPPEAKLKRWTRRLDEDADGIVLTDEYTLDGSGTVRHVLWFTHEPSINGGRIQAGPLDCELSPAPSACQVVAVDPAEHRLRDFKAGQTLYRVDVEYAVSAAPLVVRTMLAAGR